MIRLFILRAFILVMAVDLIIPFVLAPFYRGYSHRHSVMSVLGCAASPVRKIYNAWLVLGGVVFGVGAMVFTGHYFTTAWALALLLLTLLLVFAAGAMVLSGLFSVEETKKMTTLAAKIHGLGATIGFIALLLAGPVLAVLCGRREHPVLAALCWVLFVLAVAAFVLFVMADKPRFAHTFVYQEGSWQRLSLLLMYLPFVVLSVAQIVGRA